MNDSTKTHDAVDHAHATPKAADASPTDAKPDALASTLEQILMQAAQAHAARMQAGSSVVSVEGKPTL